MSLQFCITSVGMLIIQSSLNSLGTLAVTAYTIGNKIDVIMEQGPVAIGAAVSTGYLFLDFRILHRLFRKIFYLFICLRKCRNAYWKRRYFYENYWYYRYFSWNPLYFPQLYPGYGTWNSFSHRRNY